MWMGRVNAGLDDQPAFPVDNGDGVVPTFLDIGRIGRAHERDEAFVGNGAQPVGDDLQPDRIEFRIVAAHAVASGSIVMIRCPSGVTSAMSPG